MKKSNRDTEGSPVGTSQTEEIMNMCKSSDNKKARQSKQRAEQRVNRTHRRSSWTSREKDSHRT